jgi:hypothetical protein
MSVIAYQESFREMGERIYLRSPESQCSPAQSWEMSLLFTGMLDYFIDVFNSHVWKGSEHQTQQCRVIFDSEVMAMEAQLEEGLRGLTWLYCE